jgi:hypothetical protein
MRFRKLIFAVLFSTTLVEQGKSQTAPRAATRPMVATPAPARLSDALVAAIVEYSKKHTARHFPGISVYVDDIGGSQKLYIYSSRSRIARKTGGAAKSGGRYTPSAVERLDTVSISCGDEDLGDIFECALVRVTTPEGKAVKPLSYSAGPRVYQNAFGATWTVQQVLATYAARDLIRGFAADYASPDGTEWTYKVSEEDAQYDLLLTFTTDTTDLETVP